MRKLFMIVIIIALFAVPVSAMEFSPPEAPDSTEKYMPDNTESFVDGLWEILKAAVGQLQPSVVEAAGTCLSLIAVVLLVSMLQGASDSSRQVVELVGTLTLGMLLLRPTNSLLQFGIKTVQELSEYGKLLLPIMTAAMAAQGATASSSALYAGTAFFNALLSSGIVKLIVPMIYIFLCLAIANSAIGQELLKNLQNFMKWSITWCLKISVYLFTGFLGITGVLSGTADAAAIKAAKLAFSGFIPVVGSMISDASETVLISAGIMKNAVGVYGLLAILSVWIGPFLQIGIQYLLLKLTSAVCGVFGCKSSVSLIQDFSVAMGYILAMTSSVCLLLLLSTVCFMKGVA